MERERERERERKRANERVRMSVTGTRVKTEYILILGQVRFTANPMSLPSLVSWTRHLYPRCADCQDIPVLPDIARA